MSNSHAHALRDAIKVHLEIRGPYNWDEVRNKFPEVSRATFWRQVKAVRSVQTVPSEKLHRPVIQEGPPAATEPGQILKNHFLPPSFSPAQNLAEYERLLRDAKEMGRQAINAQGKITNWKMLQKSIELCRSLLDAQTEAVQALTDLEAIQGFYNAIVDTVAEASPELAKEVILRLDGVKKSHKL